MEVSEPGKIYSACIWNFGTQRQCRQMSLEHCHLNKCNLENILNITLKPFLHQKLCENIPSDFIASPGFVHNTQIVWKVVISFQGCDRGHWQQNFVALDENNWGQFQWPEHTSRPSLELYWNSVCEFGNKAVKLSTLCWSTNPKHHTKHEGKSSHTTSFFFGFTQCQLQYTALEM